MRINGFEQIKGFYSWIFDNQDKDIKPQHISLYLFLLNQNNRVNWIEWFKSPYDLAMTGSCIGSKKTYYNCLNELQEWGIIKYEKGSNNWKAPKIKLEVLKCTSTVPLSEPVPTPLPTQVPTPLATQLGTHKYKLLTDNVELVKDNIEGWIDSYSEEEVKVEYSFEDFWNQYDKKSDRKKCETKFGKLKPKDKLAIMETLESYVQATPDLKYRKNPLTYLNGECWNDELPQLPEKPKGYNPSDTIL